MLVLSSIISNIQCMPSNMLSMQHALQLTEKWFDQALNKHGVLSLFSEWSPPRDTEEVESPLNSRNTIEILKGTCSKYSSSMRPRLIVNPLNSNLLNPGIWPYEKSQPDGLIIEANKHGKSRLLLQVQNGSPEPLKKIAFYFSSQLPESVTVYISSDKRSWSTLYMRHRPYVQRKCIIHARDRMVMYVSIDLEHSKASGGAYVPHGLCGLKVYKSVEYGSAMLSKVSNRRLLIKDMHIWYLNMAITADEPQIVKSAIRNLFKLAVSSGSLCSSLTIILFYFEGKKCVKESEILEDTKLDLKMLLLEIDKQKRKLSNEATYSGKR